MYKPPLLASEMLRLRTYRAMHWPVPTGPCQNQPLLLMKGKCFEVLCCDPFMAVLGNFFCPDNSHSHCAALQMLPSVPAALTGGLLPLPQLLGSIFLAGSTDCVALAQY